MDLRELLRDESPLEPNEVQQLERLIAGAKVSELRREAHALQMEIDRDGAPGPGPLSRLGVAWYLLGQHDKAVECLAGVSRNALTAYYHALALQSLGRFSEAEEQFEKAAKQGHDPVECTLRRAEAVRLQGRVDEAEKTVRSVAKEGASRAEYVYQIGCILADRGDTYGAIEYFERAVDMSPHHSRALFRLAGEEALRGNDEEAIRLYEQSLSRPPHYLGAMLNLGLLYEDKENYPAAAYCFRRVLEIDPLHERALLYLRDIEATSDMYYDEESARLEQRMQQLLSRPVTDFELSVRSRNCLQSMNICTLGDLSEISEQDLLSGKNFGETSLHEIREMMTAYGLRIGQNVHKRAPGESFFQTHLSPQEQAILGKPISELNLSVRARKCMTRLGITTVGE
ncbi:MAG: DNA-directed RNA polymerase subunit alpha C-terminal domain-containing protein, partial [Planctomycetaceae bacterium]